MRQGFCRRYGKEMSGSRSTRRRREDFLPLKRRFKTSIPIRRGGTSRTAPTHRLVILLGFVDLGKETPLDADRRSFVPVEPSGIDVESRDGTGRSAQTDYHPSYQVNLSESKGAWIIGRDAELSAKAAHQSKEGLCLLVSHPSKSAPLGPNCPFRLTGSYIKGKVPGCQGWRSGSG